MNLNVILKKNNIHTRLLYRRNIIGICKKSLIISIGPSSELELPIYFSYNSLTA